MIYFLTRTDSVYLPPIGFSVSTGVSSITSPSYTSFVSFILKPKIIQDTLSQNVRWLYVTAIVINYYLLLLLFACYAPPSLLCRLCNKKWRYCIVLYWSLCHSRKHNTEICNMNFFLQCSDTDWASEMGPGLYKNFIAATHLRDLAYTRYPCSLLLISSS